MREILLGGSMDSSLQAHAIQAICRWLHEKYGYSKKECQAYIKGYEDATSYMDTDSECETIEVENPTFLYDSLRYYNLQINLPFKLPEFQPVRGGSAKTITCPCCSYTETFDFQMIY